MSEDDPALLPSNHDRTRFVLWKAGRRAPNTAESQVNFVPKNAVPRHDGAVEATSGEFAGWWTWTRDHYEVYNGPFWHAMTSSFASAHGQCSFSMNANRA